MSELDGKRILVEGAQRVDDSTIQAYMTVQVGEPATAAAGLPLRQSPLLRSATLPRRCVALRCCSAPDAAPAALPQLLAPANHKPCHYS